jgi:hypothetical protein
LPPVAWRSRFSQKAFVSHAALAGAAMLVRTDRARSAEAILFMDLLLDLVCVYLHEPVETR